MSLHTLAYLQVPVIVASVAAAVNILMMLGCRAKHVPKVAYRFLMCSS